jgi:hypothetical protein
MWICQKQFYQRRAGKLPALPFRVTESFTLLFSDNEKVFPLDLIHGLQFTLPILWFLSNQLCRIHEDSACECLALAIDLMASSLTVVTLHDRMLV